MGQAYRPPKRILCIDDDAAILKYERALLERRGYIVVTASSAHHGLTLALTSDVDAVVLDYQMPELTGHEVASAIKKCKPEVLIVMFSSTEIPEETVRLADAVVAKMDAVEELFRTVSHLCGQGLPA